MRLEFSLRHLHQHGLIHKPDDIYGVHIYRQEKRVVWTGEVFRKTWQVTNLGCHPWKNMVFVYQRNKIQTSLKISSRKIWVPDTAVGETAIISTVVKAPRYPCTAVSEWHLESSSNQAKHSGFNIISCTVKVLTSPQPVTN